jgi:hypothetical protein
MYSKYMSKKNIGSFNRLIIIVDLYLKVYTGAQDSLAPKDCVALISQPGLAFVQNEVTRTIACPTERAETLILALDNDVHACILLAIHATGLKHSIPTSILKHMRSQVYTQSSVEENDWYLVRTLITTEHIKSHLQKHRLRAQRSPDHILTKLGMRSCPASRHLLEVSPRYVGDLVPPFPRPCAALALPTTLLM